MSRATAAIHAAMCTFVLTFGVPGAVMAQAFPAKPVRVVIPWPPGGANDIAGRTVMQRVGEGLGQPFIIDNRGGAGGTIGAEFVAKSPADGYTLMVQSVTHVANGHLYKKLPYDTLRDFAPVALLTAQTAVLVVHPSLPVKNVKAFVALARARPDQLMYSTAGNGSIPHLSMALFASTTDTKLVHVPYKGGGPQVVGLLGGEAQASLATVASVIAHIRSGRLRALGVASASRSPTLPDVPTIAEAGVPGYELSPWIGLLAPAATPRAAIDRINAETNRVLKLPEVAQTLSAQALDPWGGTPEAFGTRLKADFAKYGKLIELTGARLE